MRDAWAWPPPLDRLIRFAAAVATGALLAAAYPRIDFSAAAWIALVPLALALAGGGSGWRCGYLAGLVWTVPNLSWLRGVTVVGWLALAAYVALYPAAWYASVGPWIRWARRRGAAADVAVSVAAAAWWIGLEWIRSWMISGFPWNLLGTSQYRQIAVIQVARFGGVYAVSFLVAMVNVAIVLTALRYVRVGARRRGLMTPHLSLSIALVAVALSVAYGARTVLRADRETDDDPGLSVALVQGNIPQDHKWDAEFEAFILGRYTELTRQAAGAGADLAVWPETASPGSVRADPVCRMVVQSVVRETGMPTLVGSIDAEWVGDGDEVRETNSAFLHTPGDDGWAVGLQRYDKIHLVPFGEYVPLERFGVTRLLTPITGSCSPGVEMNPLELPGGERFGVLICFEDAFPELAREAARNGAGFLVNITNDGWYGRTGGAFQHAANAVFRAVETDRPMARAANTGVSCFIDRFGRVERRLEGETPGDVWVHGILVGRVKPRGRVGADPDTGLTFYTRHGDTVAVLGLVVGLAAHGPVLFRRRSPRGGPARTEA